jgi:hypothetical protein
VPLIGYKGCSRQLSRAAIRRSVSDMPNFTGRIARGTIDDLKAVRGMGIYRSLFVQFLSRRKPARIGPQHNCVVVLAEFASPFSTFQRVFKLRADGLPRQFGPLTPRTARIGQIVLLAGGPNRNTAP